MADETKEGQEKRLSLGLAGPAIWQNNKPDPIPSDVDFTEPIADISPAVIEDVAKNYTQEMLKKGRKDAGTGNQYLPREGYSEAPSHQVGSAVAPSSGDKIFLQDQTNVQATGLGLPSSNSTPGTGEPGQTLGTFFTANQVSAVLDKTGADPEKSGSKLLEKDSVETIAINTQLQINEGNVNNPDNEHAADIDFTGPLDQLGSNAKDLNYPGDQGVKGAFKSGASKKGLFDLVETAYESDNSTERNPNKPRGPSKTGESLSSIGSADDFIPPSSGFFAQSTELTDSPGVTPNFFQEKGAPYPTDSPLTADNFDPGAENGVRDQVYAKLEGSNVNGPRSPYVDSAGPDNAIPFDFPDYNETNTPNPDKPFVPKETQDKGKHTLDKIEPFKESKVLVVKKSYKQLEFNAYRPGRPDENNKLDDKADTLIQHGGTDGSVWFQADQNTNIDGVVGSSLRNNLIDKELQGDETSIVLTSDLQSTFRKKSGSALVGKTGPQKSGDVDSVPKPGEIANYNRIAAEKDPTGVIAAVIDMLQEKNIYSPTGDSPFFKGGSTDEDIATQGMFTVQRELGKFVPRQDAADPDGDSASGTRVTFDSMKKIGSAFLVRGTGDFAGSAGLLAAGVLGQEGVIETLINPVEQIGLAGIDIANLKLKSMAPDAPEELQKILDAATGNDYIMATKQGSLNGTSTALATRGTSVTPYNSVSHGQVNNFLEPFGNGALLDATGMLFIASNAIASLLGLSLAVQAIVDSLISFDKDEGKNKDSRNPSNLQFGRYKALTGEDTGDFLSAGLSSDVMRIMLRIPETDSGFSESLSAGLPLMLGFPGTIDLAEVEASLQTGQGLIDFAFNLFTAPSYYVNYLRNVIMSGQQVTNSFIQIGSGFGTQGLEKFFSSIDKVVNSKIYQFLMIAAGVGDANLKSLFGAPGVSNEETLYQTKGKLSVNARTIGGNTKFLASVDRLNERDISNLRAVAKARQNVTRWGGAYKNPLSLSTFPASSVSDTRLSSLPSVRSLVASKENVRLMEEAIDAEYMPFYFHDLRTDEIISMPAFVTSFDDSFTPNYNAISSYGRQDPVRIYQGTERTINLTFKLVAFNKSDFTAMWYTINKFVSMVYPQYSQGVERSLETSSTGGVEQISFIQPFSQVPAASPLIRIRLGDLYKSNYSNTALQNLFGASPNNVQSFGTKLAEGFKGEVTKQKIRDEEIRRVRDSKDDEFKNNVDKKYLRIEVNESLLVKLAPGELARLRKDKSSQEFINPGKKLATIPKDTMIVLENTVVISKGKKQKTNATISIYNKQGLSKTVKIDNLNDIYKDFSEPNFEWPNGEGEQATYKGPLLDVVNQKYRKELNSALDAAELRQDANVTQNFFKQENNAIVRSFQSTRGRGLAGFITTLSFDYSESTWSIDEGNRAPKSVSVTMAFSPVHDLPMGLDADGRLRALSHPVGAFANKQGGFGDVYSDEERVNDDKPYKDTIAALDKTRQGSDTGGGILF